MAIDVNTILDKANDALSMFLNDVSGAQADIDQIAALEAQVAALKDGLPAKQEMARASREELATVLSEIMALGQ